MLGRAVMTAGIALALAGTAVGSSSSPKRFVLRLQDMPTGFKVDKSHFLSAAEVEKESNWTRGQLRAWGWVTAYERDFSRDVSVATALKGAIEVDSTVSVYRSEAGAHASLKQTGRRCRTAPSHRLSIGARIGNEAFLCARVTTSNGHRFQVYNLIWRRGNLKGSVNIGGLKGGTPPTEAVSLAKIQDRRMR